MDKLSWLKPRPQYLASTAPLEKKRLEWDVYVVLFLLQRHDWHHEDENDTQEDVVAQKKWKKLNNAERNAWWAQCVIDLINDTEGDLSLFEALRFMPHSNDDTPLVVKTDDGVVVFEGSIWNFVVGAWANGMIPQGLQKSELDKHLDPNTSFDKWMDQMCVRRAHLPIWKKMWNNIPSDTPPSSFLWGRMSKLLSYSETDLSVLGHPSWQTWAQHVAKTDPSQLIDVLTHLMLSDRKSDEKTHLVYALGCMTGVDVLKDVWGQLKHEECFKRGMFGSWFAVALGLGVARQEAVLAHKEKFFKWLSSFADDANVLIKHQDLWPLFGDTPDIHAHVAKSFWETREYRKTPRAKGDGVEGWVRLQEANLVPQHVSWTELQAAAQEGLPVMPNDWDQTVSTQRDVMMQQNFHSFISKAIISNSLETRSVEQLKRKM